MRAPEKGSKLDTYWMRANGMGPDKWEARRPNYVRKLKEGDPKSKAVTSLQFAQERLVKEQKAAAAKLKASVAAKLAAAKKPAPRKKKPVDPLASSEEEEEERPKKKKSKSRERSKGKSRERAPKPRRKTPPGKKPTRLEKQLLELQAEEKRIGAKSGRDAHTGRRSPTPTEPREAAGRPSRRSKTATYSRLFRSKEFEETRGKASRRNRA